MSFLMIFKVALRAIWRNKVRSALTALGIIVGIAAVIAVIAIGQGASTQMQNSISGMGHNLVMVFPGSLSSGGARLGAGMSTTLTAEDGTRIAQELPHYVLAVCPMVNANAQVMYMSNNWATNVNGVGPDFTIVRKWDVGEGSFFTDADVKSGHRVAVIGQTVATPVGKNIRINNQPFTVIGVLQSKGQSSMGQDQDDIILMPYTTVRRVLQNSIFSNVNMLMVSLHSLDDLKPAKAEIEALLRMRHRLGDNKANDFDVRDMTEVVDSVTSISRMMTILLGVVAFTERTKEIGLRMAIGAKPRDILVQFLLESIVLSCVGGLVGVACGVGGALIVGNIQKWPILITESSIAVSFTFSALVGIFFGFYPAWRASRLNPIDCLRYE